MKVWVRFQGESIFFRAVVAGVICWVFGRLGQQAVTLDSVVYLTRRWGRLSRFEQKCTLVHEAWHVRQQRWLRGPLFWLVWVPGYLLLGLRTLLRSLVTKRTLPWAWEHPWERKAYEFEDEYRRGPSGEVLM